MEEERGGVPTLTRRRPRSRRTTTQIQPTRSTTDPSNHLTLTNLLPPPTRQAVLETRASTSPLQSSTILSFDPSTRNPPSLLEVGNRPTPRTTLKSSVDSARASSTVLLFAGSVRRFPLRHPSRRPRSDALDPRRRRIDLLFPPPLLHPRSVSHQSRASLLNSPSQEFQVPSRGGPLSSRARAIESSPLRSSHRGDDRDRQSRLDRRRTHRTLPRRLNPKEKALAVTLLDLSLLSDPPTPPRARPAPRPSSKADLPTFLPSLVSTIVPPSEPLRLTPKEIELPPITSRRVTTRATSKSRLPPFFEDFASTMARRKQTETGDKEESPWISTGRTPALR